MLWNSCSNTNAWKLDLTLLLASILSKAFSWSLPTTRLISVALLSPSCPLLLCSTTPAAVTSFRHAGRQIPIPCLRCTRNSNVARLDVFVCMCVCPYQKLLSVLASARLMPSLYLPQPPTLGVVSFVTFTFVRALPEPLPDAVTINSCGKIYIRFDCLALTVKRSRLIFPCLLH